MHDNIDIPDIIDDYIAKGIKKGKRTKSNRMIKRTTTAVTCLIIMFLLVGIRVSPVMAANVAKIPGLKYIVELVRFDKGLTSAIENDYIQHVEKSDEKMGVVFTVKDIIADNSGIIVFYSIENKGGYKWPHIADIKVLDPTGKDLEMSSSFGYGPTEDIIYEGQVDFHIVNENNGIVEMPDTISLQTKIAVNKDADSNNSKAVNAENVTENQGAVVDTVLDEVWIVEFAIDKSKFSGIEKVYTINQKVEVEGQKILFENIRIYPTKSILKVSFDEANSKRIFAFEDLKLVDENGREWGRINNGITGSFPDENSQTLNFQSNYFYKPKKLYLTGNSIRALDKDKCYFTVDTDMQQIITPYNLLTIKDINLNNKRLALSMEIKKDIADNNFSYDISNEVFDVNGNKINIISSGMGSTTDKSYINYELKLPENFKGPIKFKLHNYPTKIKDDFKVKIPLD